MSPLIDVDQHLFETRSCWREYIDPAQREDALSIEDDDLGWPWLTWRGRRLYPAEVQRPGHPEEVGGGRRAMAAGAPAPAPYEELLPPEYGGGRPRVACLDRMGVDATVLFPNFGLLWEEMLAEHPGAQRANMTAYNRWMAEQVDEGRERLYGVGHLSLRDRDWALGEIQALSAAGIRLAMVAPSPVDGRPLSDPSLDPLWAAMCAHGVSPVFHVANFPGPLDPAWYQGDPEPVDRLMDSVMLWVAPAVALANLILHGTLERFEDLRLGVVELTAGWVPGFLVQLDGASDFYTARHGGPMRHLALRPSEYFRRQVKVAALPYEGPGHLIELAGPELFMFGSDWPHAEGVAHPGAQGEAAAGTTNESGREGLLADNARWLLGMTRTAQ